MFHKILYEVYKILTQTKLETMKKLGLFFMESLLPIVYMVKIFVQFSIIPYIKNLHNAK